MALDIVAWGAITFGLAVATQLIAVIPATIFKTDKLTDIAGAFGFFVLALVGLLWPSDYFARQIVLCSLQMLWSVRLAIYSLVRIGIRKKDSRFDEMRKVWWKWAFFWLTQITWIWVVSLPVSFIVATHENNPLDGADYTGWAIFGCALLMETIADWHRLSFNKKKGPDEKKFIHTYLWKYSRHPNYFAEIFVWFGIWLSSSNGLWGIETAYGVLGLFSPVVTFVLLTFISGIPPAEKRDDGKYGDMAEYVQYKKQTSPLWPCIPALYDKAPMWLRKTLFIDIRDYTKLQNRNQEAAPERAEEANAPAAPEEPATGEK